MKKLTLISFIPPSINGDYLKPRVVRSGSKVFPQMFETKIAKKYKEQFKQCVEESICSQQWVRPIQEGHHMYADGRFFFPKKGMDPNNYWKCMLDAITDVGKVWKDDSIVCERTMQILVDAKNPRIELEIYPVEYEGIFDTKKDLMVFQNRCASCSLYAKGRCSILIKCIKGYVVSEVFHKEENQGVFQCVKYKLRRL